MAKEGVCQRWRSENGYDGDEDDDYFGMGGKMIVVVDVFRQKMSYDDLRLLPNWVNLRWTFQYFLIAHNQRKGFGQEMRNKEKWLSLIAYDGDVQFGHDEDLYCKREDRCQQVFLLHPEML